MVCCCESVCSRARKAQPTVAGQYTVEYRGGLLYVDDEEGLVQFGWRGYFLTGRLHESVTGHGLMGYNSFRANVRARQ